MKKAVIIYENNEPLYVCEVKELDSLKFVELVEKARQKQLVAAKEKEDLNKKINELEIKLNALRGKVLYDEGKITSEDLKNGNY